MSLHYGWVFAQESFSSCMLLRGFPLQTGLAFKKSKVHHAGAEKKVKAELGRGAERNPGPSGRSHLDPVGNSRFFQNLAKIAWQLLQLQFFGVAFLPTFCIQKYEAKAKIRLAGLQEAWDHSATVVLRQGRQFSTKNKASMCSWFSSLSSLPGPGLAKKCGCFHGFFRKSADLRTSKFRLHQKPIFPAPHLANSIESCKINQLTAEGWRPATPVSYLLLPWCWKIECANVATRSPHRFDGYSSVFQVEY